MKNQAGVYLNSGAPVAREQEKAWRLVWQAEFNKPGLPDPAVWCYESGMIRNKEPQCYRVGSLKNSRVENDRLVIEAHREQVKNPGFLSGSSEWNRVEFAEYSSASITTELSTAWRYGRIEVCAKLPHAIGSWPAIWLLGKNFRTIGWPKCGEIDIMENWGSREAGLEAERIHGAAHYFSDTTATHHKSAGANIDAGAHWENFHLFAIEWDEEKIEYYYDAARYFTFDLKHADVGPDNPFRQPMYLLLNLALFDNQGSLKDSDFPMRYEVAYVRVFECAGNP